LPSHFLFDKVLRALQLHYLLVRATMAGLALAAAAAVSTLLTVNTTVVSDKAWVRVTYSGLPQPYSSNFFGVFYPGDANVSAVPALPCA
jgi:hypothetical protein